MTISLSPDLEKSIAARISSGEYKTPSEVVEAGLRLLDKQEEARKIRLEQLRAMVDAGIEQMDAGMGIDVDHAFDEVERELFGNSASAS
ncbi:MAG: type II toxin-antitoxin system ParD family antitoxin [Planctomycetales bacterium]|nr:type II toxin-antitoxin system ParD family antitoxin [Planctomycetales bacterium]